jgi:ectoine hydroxylase-related dioxygenase (phytanoyl-CoA dioxygenase family)
MNAREQIEKLGYILIPNLISSEQCDIYRQLLERDYKKFSSSYAGSGRSTSHGLDNKAMEKVVYNVHNKDLSWYMLFEHPKILEILDFMLIEGSYKNSEPYYLYNNSARCPLKGNPGQQLHLDSRLPGINFCIVANVLWLLDDFTPENGATRIVPGSHKYSTFAEDGKRYDKEILLTAKKGSAIIFNANLWHGGGGNINGESRWALALGYARWFIKPAFDYMQNTPKEIYDQLTLAQKKLMGFDLVAPKDEFSRVRRRSDKPEIPQAYKLPFIG